MTIVPKKIAERIQWWEDHVAPFTSNAVAIGITSAEATDLAAKATAARAAFDAQKAAQQAAEAATLALRDADNALNHLGSALIKKVRAKAEQTGGYSVYGLANIPAPAIPGPVGGPGTPYQFKAALKPNGSVELTWKCNNPAGCNGVIYQVYRKVIATGEYAYVGGTGQRKFVDATLPAGVASVLYQVQGTRTTAVGDAAEFVVNFGVNPAGAATVTTASSAKSAGTGAKIAA